MITVILLINESDWEHPSFFFVMPINFSTRAFSSEATKAKFIAPLPVIGLNATFAVSPKLSIKQSIHLFNIKVTGYKGAAINDINICVEYNPWNHFGFGLGYNYYHLGISSKSDNGKFLKFQGEVNSEHTGLVMYAPIFFKIRCSYSEVHIETV